MVPSELIKVKKIPNTRILVKQVIWEVKIIILTHLKKTFSFYINQSIDLRYFQ